MSPADASVLFMVAASSSLFAVSVIFVTDAVLKLVRAVRGGSDDH